MIHAHFLLFSCSFPVFSPEISLPNAFPTSNVTDSTSTSQRFIIISPGPEQNRYSRHISFDGSVQAPSKTRAAVRNTDRAKRATTILRAGNPKHCRAAPKHPAASEPVLLSEGALPQHIHRESHLQGCPWGHSSSGTQTEHGKHTHRDISDDL